MPQSDYDRDIRLTLGFDLPIEAPTDYFIEYILMVFNKAHRARSYVTGMAVSPLPLHTQNITEVTNVYQSPIDRETLDYCIFALDDIFIKDYTNAREPSRQDQ